MKKNEALTETLLMILGFMTDACPIDVSDVDTAESAAEAVSVLDVATDTKGALTRGGFFFDARRVLLLNTTVTTCKLCEGTKINTETGEKCVRCVQRAARTKVAREARETARQAEVTERVSAAAPILAKLDSIATGKSWGVNIALDMARKIRDGMPVSDKMAALIDKMMVAHEAPPVVRGTVGKVGEKIDLTLTLTGIYFLGDYIVKGTHHSTALYIYNFEDATGNLISWRTSHSPGNHTWDDGGLKSDDFDHDGNWKGRVQVQVKGTIKEHATIEKGRYAGSPKTVLERAKLTFKLDSASHVA